MSKLTIMEAVKVVPVSESTLRRDLKTGKVSFTTAKNGKKVIDTAELERAYDDLNVSEPQLNGNGGDLLAIKDNQIDDLRSQLEKAELQLEIATTEKSKLLDLVSDIQAEKRALMPAVEDRNSKRPRWLSWLVGA